MADGSDSFSKSDQNLRQAGKLSLKSLLRISSPEKNNLPTSIEDALLNTKDPYVSETLDRLHAGEILWTVKRSRLSPGNQARFCRLDKDLLYFRYSLVGCGCTSYVGRKKEKKVDLRRIHVRLGLQENSKDESVKSSTYFSIVFDNSSRLPLSFITSDEESAKDWVLALNYLKKKLSSIHSRLQFELSAWELFNTSRSTRDGHVTLREAKTSLIRHGLSLKREATSKYATTKASRGHHHHHHLSFQSYFEMYQEAFSRSEINDIFYRISADKTSITARELYRFIQETQGEENITEKECEEIIFDYEIDDGLRLRKLLSCRGFGLYMTSSRCELFNWRHDTVYQDMNQPLAHYYVASSHNTYLTGDQITDPSSVDAYMNVLLKGCRCVELDCWDGPDGEPHIYHGYTLTSKIKFKDVVEVIGRYAFEASDYPLILSLENHCSLAQQEKMAIYLKTILGSELLTSPIIPLGDTCTLPSPSALRGRILLKGKTLSRGKSTNDIDDYDEVAEDDINMSNLTWNEKAWMQQSCSKYSFSRNQSNSSSFTSASASTSYSFIPNWKVSPSLSELVVYFQSVKFTSLDTTQANAAEISSFSEGKWKRLTKAGPEPIIEYHKHKLSRVYPGGSRTDSSNYDPQPLWNLGFQLVALNYQTKCDEMDINRGKFRQNGNCGYILKPEFQRLPQRKDDNPKSCMKSLKIRVVSGPDCGKNFKREGLMMEITITGDRDDFIRRTMSCAGTQNRLEDLPADFEHTIYFPELAIVRFLLKDTCKMREKIGQYTLPFTSAAQGYRHIPFLDNNGVKVTGVYVFVHVTIEDLLKSTNNSL